MAITNFFYNNEFQLLKSTNKYSDEKPLTCRLVSNICMQLSMVRIERKTTLRECFVSALMDVALI